MGDMVIGGNPCEDCKFSKESCRKHKPQCLFRDDMEQPLMLQSNCEECVNYDGFGACLEHGYNLVEQCKDYKKGE